MVTKLPKQWFYVWAVLAQDVVILTEFFFFLCWYGWCLPRYVGK